MSTVTTAPVTLADWDRDWSRREQRYELVRGVPVMPPTESIGNKDATWLLAAGLRAALDRRRHRCVMNIAVHLGEDPAGRSTIREPDVAVVARALPRSTHRVEPSDVAFVAEIVSPGSVETDHVTKRAEYAAAGIPTYLVVDVRDPDHPTLTLYELREGAYPDATPSPQVTAHIDGTPVTLRAADLVD